METLQKQSLFWDVNSKSIDPKKHRRFIIERILARGDVDDVRWAKGFYGDGALKEGLLKAKTIDRKSLFFLVFLF